MPAGRGDIPIDPFRDAFLASGLTAGEVGRRLGWTKPDSERVRNQLGLRSQKDRHGKRSKRQMVTYENAELLCEALDLDPTEVGL